MIAAPLTCAVQEAQGGDGRRHILVLHGLGDSMAGWQPAAAAFACGDHTWCFVNAPEPYGPYGGYSWFDIAPDMSPDLAGVAHSRHLLDQTIAVLLAERGITSDDLVLLGFSQGCLMVLDQALRGSRRFAAVVGISGWVAGLDDFPEAFGPHARAQRILMTHGRQDELLPVDLVRDQAQRLKALGLDLAWAEYDKGHHLDPEEEIPDIRAFLRHGP
mgnify:CR=1 FL=1